MFSIETPIESITRIPEAYRKKLKKLGIKRAGDLIFYFPYRYDDFSNITPIAKIIPGQMTCVQGKILQITNNRTYIRKFNITEAVIQDNSGAIAAKWFGQPYMARVLQKGDEVALAGKIANGKRGFYFSNPVYEKIYPDKETAHTSRIVPVYSLTHGVSSRWIRYILKLLLPEILPSIKEILPREIAEKEKLMPIQSAIKQAHFPDNLKIAQEAKNRFAYEELFLLELAMLREKYKMASHQAIELPIKLEAMQRFVKSLPFELTDDQKKTVWRILKDMERPRPMSRLLQGDVGSGKTAVAAIASLNAIKNGCQAAFMAPTEILAGQHFKTISKVFEGFNVNVGFLTGKHDEFISKKLKGQPIEISRKRLIAQIEKGDINIVVGTHALIQKSVKFNKLGLVVIDEQHRFGVEQRAKLVKQKPPVLIPHLLSMTATPIPRSLALTIYGDLDISVIKQLPKGRKKIITEAISEDKRQETYDFIKKEIKNGRQAYVICPRIEESEKDEGEERSPWDDVKSAIAEYKRLQTEIFPEFRIGLLHGKMSTKEKDRVMADFKYGKIDILVSTSVVEVGVDVPNATVMLIEGAERFGLSQLHQFRGRVGRSDHQSYCFLFVGSITGKSRERAGAMVDFSSGFDISRKDLEIRGPGDISGIKQSGMPDLVMASLGDIEKIEKVREAAITILESDLNLSKYPALRIRLDQFRDNLHLE